MIYKFEITYNGTTTEVGEPVGWSKVEFIERRDEDFEGVFFEFSTALKFYGVAYNIIKSAFENEDLLADISVTIYHRKVSFKPFEIFFDGKILFEEIDIQDTFLSVVLEKNDILRILKNSIDKTVEITPNKTVTLHSFPLIFNAKFSCENNFSYGKSSYHTPPFVPTNEEIDVIITPDIAGKNAVFYNETLYDRTLNVDGFLKVIAQDTGNLQFDAGVVITLTVQEVGAAYVSGNDIVIYDTQIPSSPYYSHEITIDETVVIPPNSNLIIFAHSKEQSNLSSPVEWSYHALSNLSYSEETTLDPTLCKGVTYYEAFTQICTEIGVPFASSALQEADKLHNVLTNGYNVRQKENVIKTTFKDLFNTVKILFKLGLVVENNQITIKNYDDIYDTTQSAQLITKYSDISIRIDKDKAVSKIELSKSQYKINETATINFEDEFNTKSAFEIQVIKTPKAIKETMKIITASVVIEAVRRRKRLDSNSYSEDEKLFHISLNRTPVTDAIIYKNSNTYAIGEVAERNETLTITNHNYPNHVYNARYSPRTLIKNILKQYYNSSQNVYNYTTSEGNRDITIAGTNENEHIGITPFSLKSPKRLSFVTDEAINSLFLEVSNYQCFIIEKRTKSNSATSLNCVIFAP